MYSAKIMPPNSDKMYQDLRQKTIPGLLLERVAETPKEVAYRIKKLGIYRERTWSDFGLMVAHCAIGFMGLGLKKGERLALMGDPCEEYVICEMAAQAFGAIPYGIYPTSSQKELRYLIANGGASIFVGENQEYVDRILPFRGQFGHLRHIVIIDTMGTFMDDHAFLVSFQSLIHDGEKQIAKKPGIFEEIVHQIKPTDSSFIIYTSGTTGNPKGVLISHGKHLAAVYSFIDRYPLLKEFPHRTVVYLPLSDLLGKIVAITLPLLTRIVPNYGEDIEDLGKTIFEIAPTVLFTVPRYLQKFASNITAGIENSTPLKKLLYNKAIKTGQRHIERVWNNRRDRFLSLLYFLACQMVFKPILNKIGFGKLKIGLSANAPISAEVMALWQIYGVNLCEIYMQAETGGAIIASQEAPFPRPGHVGVPPHGWEVKLSEDGEILVRGSDICESYWNNPDLTKEVIGKGGWLHTGDLGEWTSDGNLKIMDRSRNMIVTSNGKILSPASIENILKSSPYISEAMVVGQGRKYLSALIEINFETVSEWALLNDIPYTNIESLIQQPAIIKLIDSEIKKVNQRLALDERIHSFRMIPKVLDPGRDDEPVTSTRKVKRDLMYIEFSKLIDSMYSEKQG
jgi:long-chain acyl-CoA synthetase